MATAVALVDAAGVIDFTKRIIRIPSPSRQEAKVAQAVATVLGMALAAWCGATHGMSGAVLIGAAWLAACTLLAWRWLPREAR